jgi:hypothetical protein
MSAAAMLISSRSRIGIAIWLMTISLANIEYAPVRHSSVWQSNALLRRWSEVRVLLPEQKA